MGDGQVVEASSVDEVQAIVREARAAGTRLRIVGGRRVERFGSQPSGVVRYVSLRRLGSIEIAGPDFTARVGAGVCPAELDAALQPLGLVWPLRRLEAPGTIGGLIASGRGTTITARDAPARRWVLGARLVDGTGEVLTVGGATVKNSVGYGVTHALWGSQGRLGAIVELTLRLRRRQPSDDDPGETLDGGGAAGGHSVGALRRPGAGHCGAGTRRIAASNPGCRRLGRNAGGWVLRRAGGRRGRCRGTACRGDRDAGGAGGQPGEGLAGDSDGAGGAGSGGGVCLEVTGPDSGAVIYVKLFGLMRLGGRQMFVAGAGCPEDPSP